MNNTETVRLGDHVLPVVPQRHARLRHRLSSDDFGRIMSADYGVEAYRVLSVLIPALPESMPLYEFEGFESEEAMKNDAYDEAKDKSPTTAELIGAFETAFMVSGAGRMGKIVDLIQMGAQVQVPEATPTPTPASPASPISNGDSPSTTTGAKNQT